MDNEDINDDFKKIFTSMYGCVPSDTGVKVACIEATAKIIQAKIIAKELERIKDNLHRIG